MMLISEMERFTELYCRGALYTPIFVFLFYLLCFRLLFLFTDPWCPPHPSPSFPSLPAALAAAILGRYISIGRNATRTGKRFGAFKSSLALSSSLFEAGCRADKEIQK